MTTIALPRRAAPWWSASSRQLGRVEARRMLRHPAYPIGMLYIVAFTVSVIANNESVNVANTVYIVLFLAVVLVYAPMTIVAANRVAAATYRRKVREALDGTPLPDRQRTWAVIIGMLRGPVLVTVVVTAALAALGPFTTSAVADPSDAVHPRTVLEYLQFPVLVLGAGLLGIAIARWLPWPGLLPVTAIVVWLGTVALYRYAGSDQVVPAITWFALWPVWIASNTGMLPRQPLGQEMWHLVYLAGLSGLAGVAALLRTPGPRRGLWITAGGLFLVTAVAAWLQLG